MRVWVALLVACSAPREPTKPPSNLEPPPAEIQIADGQSFGWLGLSPTAARDDSGPAWLPVDPSHAVLVPMPAEGLERHPTVTAFGAGGAQRLTVGGEARVPFGCEQNALHVRVLDGPRVAPGMVWIPPPDMPASWKPAGVAVVAGAASAVSRTYTVGPLSIGLVRSDAMHGSYTIYRGDRRVYSQPFVRGTEMAGSSTPPIDLTESGPGVPAPVAAWSLSPRGPHVVAFVMPTWEGQQIFAVLVADHSSYEIEALGGYLYLCAY